MTPDEVLAEGDRQAGSQDGSHVVLDGYEWGVLRDEITRLRKKAEGLLELLERYDEIRSTVQAQVLAWDAIQKASGSSD
jgi:hypothetical protein